MDSGKRIIRHSRYIRILSLALGVVLALSVFALPVSWAQGDADASHKNVRVGWYKSDMFQEGQSDREVKSGYCYDYLQKVADYTSWEYEYVYGSWTELFRMLQRGEIDCLGGVSITPERRNTMLFPDFSMGTDQYYLYKRLGDHSISASDLSTLNGKKVGGICDNQITALTLEWIAEKDLDLEVIYFDSFEDQENAFRKGEIDLLAQTINNVLSLENITIVAKVGEDPFYLAISKGREDLLVELNESLNTILSIDPFVLQNLQYTNYGTTLVSRTLTEPELSWVAEHPVITLAYLENYLPYSDTGSDGQVTGLVTDTMEAILESLELQDRIKVEYLPCKSFEQMAEALRNGSVDLAFPVYGNLWALEQNKIDASSPVVQGTESFVYKGSFDRDTVERIAVNENNAMQIAYCKNYFPEVELVYCDSIEECLNLVMGGQVCGTIVNTLRTELVAGNSRYKSLSFVQLKGDDSRCFGLSENNRELMLILNRGIRMIGSSFGIESSYKYLESFYSYSLADLLRDNAAFILPLLVVIAGGIILLLTVNLHRKALQVSEKEAHINQVKALNSQLEEMRRKADAANAAKTSFLFDMSHDIRTPMNAIMGFSSLMEKNLDKPEILKDELHKIRTSGEYLLNLINNMLEVARIDSGKETITEEFTDIKEDSITVVGIFEEELKKKNLKLSSSIEVEHRYVLADTHKLKEIAINLVSNAIKYTPVGGHISLKLEEIPCRRPGYATYAYSVSDDGIGMSPEFKDKIFESFSREHNTTESRIAGTGLGMSIVKRLVDLMDGKVEVESHPGRGSRFTVTLTHKIVEDPAPYLENRKKSQTFEKPDLSGSRILLTEDNELNAEIALAILEDFGLKAELAKDGRECLSMVENQPAGYYDLILMDVQMPVMNGYEATTHIRALKDKAKASIPIIALTANAFDEDRKNALAAGMDGHLAKPIEITQLTRVLCQFLKK